MFFHRSLNCVCYQFRFAGSTHKAHDQSRQKIWKLNWFVVVNQAYFQNQIHIGIYISVYRYIYTICVCIDISRYANCTHSTHICWRLMGNWNPVQDGIKMVTHDNEWERERESTSNKIETKFKSAIDVLNFCDFVCGLECMCGGFVFFAILMMGIFIHIYLYNACRNVKESTHTQRP